MDVETYIILFNFCSSHADSLPYMYGEQWLANLHTCLNSFNISNNIKPYFKS